MRLPQDIAQRILYEKARRSFAEFARQAWRHVESTAYDHNWHLDVMAEHLEAVHRGEILRFLLNVPPRTLKSTYVNVLFPCWEWGDLPILKYLTSSYDADLSVRDNVKSRDLIKTSWYQSYIRYCAETRGEDPGTVWQLKGDQNVKGRYENTSGGHRIATSVGGAATGEGGDRVMVDDPLSAKGALSEVKLEEAITWWDRTMSSRLNDQRVGSKIIVMQRLHINDLAGHVLKQGGWDHLLLPMEYSPIIRINGIDLSPHDYPTSLGYIDPRSEHGELLFPTRFPPAVVAQLKKDLGPVGYAGQYQQTPLAEGGNLFKRAWFPIEEVAPARSAFRAMVRYWDKAGTEGAGCYTVGILMAVDNDGVYWILDEVRGQWADAEREAIIKQTAALDRKTYGRNMTTWIEQEPGSSGKDVARQTIKNLAGHDCQAERPTGDKVTRARPMAAQAAGRNVKIVSAPWNKEYLDEVELFPNGLKDRVDASSGAFNKLADAELTGAAKMRALSGRTQ